MKTIPKHLPHNMRTTVDVVRQTSSQRECLKKAYALLTQKYYGNRLQTVTHFAELFPRSLEEVWSRSGFLHCTNMNWLLRVLLVKSGHFSEEDVVTRWTLLWYVSPHQFLHITMHDGQKLYIDAWAKAYGIPFGEYAHGFHAYGKR